MSKKEENNTKSRDTDDKHIKWNRRIFKTKSTNIYDYIVPMNDSVSSGK